MVCIVSLSAEHLAVVRDGAVPDPTYRPWRGGRYDNEDWLAEGDETDEDTVAEPRSGAFVAGGDELALPMVLAGAWWRRHDAACGVVVAREGDVHRLIALVRVESGARLGNTGTRRGELTDRAVLRPSLDLAEILREVGGRSAQKILEIVTAGTTRPLPRAAAAAFNSVLRSRIASYDSMAVRLGRPPARRLQLREPRDHQRLDAVTTTLRIFDRGWRQLEPEPEPTDPPAPIVTLTRLYENEAITDDSNLFPGWDRSRTTAAGWWEFRAGDGRRLRIKNIDAGRYEQYSGADLVYMRREPESFVLVQYKMLTHSRDTGWGYTEDPRLQRQLRRMRETTDPGPPEELTLDNFRLSSGSSFVKFVEGAVRPRDDDELLPGYYLPTAYAALLFPENRHGAPRPRIVMPFSRYLDNQTFVRLVRDFWVGTAWPASTGLREYLLGTGSGRESTDLTFAYEDSHLGDGL